MEFCSIYSAENAVDRGSPPVSKLLKNNSKIANAEGIFAFNIMKPHTVPEAWIADKRS